MGALVVAGADLVLPDRVARGATLVIEGGRIVDIVDRVVDGPAGAVRVDGRGALAVPGFVDAHIHGVDGIDVLSGDGAVARVARRLPRYGVTAFCPTTVACPAADLTAMLQATRQARAEAVPAAARVLPAHLESNFISPSYRGAQPAACLRRPPGCGPPTADAEFSSDDILAAIDDGADVVGIVTMAPELEGGLDLVRRLAGSGIRVSIGHTGATYEQAIAAIEAGARRVTHLFNRMTPMTHRAPGVPGAAFDREDVAAEIIGDGAHVHPVMMRLAVGIKGVGRVMAITDATAGAGLPPGSRARLGPSEIVVGDRVATLADGTLAGSVVTMDRVFAVLVREVGLSVSDAARLCATTPAAELGLEGQGRLVVGAEADVAVLDSDSFRVRQTLVGGTPALEP
ncbi:MAG: N-acetylglucosamine-6-phosphate deacetylase [Acidobacteriota bacterium]